MKIEKPKPQFNWNPVLISLIAVGALVFLPMYFFKPPNPPAFEISNFSGSVEVYDAKNKTWQAPKRGQQFGANDKIRTGANGQINFQLEDKIQIRLKENSAIRNEAPNFFDLFDKKTKYQLFLEKGVLLGNKTKNLNEDKERLQITTPVLVASVRGTVFRIEVPTEDEEDAWVGVLRGQLEVREKSFFPTKPILIRGLEQATFKDGELQKSKRVTRKEWGEMKEAYELLSKSAAMEARQMDLSKEAGGLFDYVFDHGTFYTPKIGFASREFFRNEETGQVYLEVGYDVFPKGSFVGVYFKIRNLDAADFAGLSFDVKENLDEGVPDSFSIELKSKGAVVRRFAPRGFKQNWQEMEFDFHARKETPITEITFVFSHQKVGEAKKGSLEFRNFELIPLPETPEDEIAKISPNEIQKVAALPEKKIVPETTKKEPEKPAEPVVSGQDF